MSQPLETRKSHGGCVWSLVDGGSRSFMFSAPNVGKPFSWTAWSAGNRK